MKKIITYIVLTAFLISIIPIQTMAQSINPGAIINILKASLKNKPKAPMTINDLKKKEDKTPPDPPINISEINLNGDNTDDFLYGNSVYYNTLKKMGRLDLLGENAKDIDDIIAGKKKPGEKSSENEKEKDISVEKIPVVPAPVAAQAEIDEEFSLDTLIQDYLSSNQEPITQEIQEEPQESELQSDDTEQTDIESEEPNDQKAQSLKESVNRLLPSNASLSHRSNRYIIKYKEGQQDTGHEDISAAIGSELNKQEKNPKSSFDKVEINEAIPVGQFIFNIVKNKADSAIDYIQPDYNVNLESNDSYFELQWGLKNNTTLPESDLCIDANIVPAWEYSQGEEVIVAVIDSGIDITHEDLNANIWQNSNEIPDNGLDDDDNGFIDDISGWNFYDDNNTIHDPKNSSDEMHGTNVAGIIAGIKDNGTGIAGAAPAVKILPLKAFANGTAYTSDIIEAIEYAQELGVKIVNCSWGMSGENQALREAMADKTMLFVCAAGNSGKDIYTDTVSPASFTLPNVITAAAINKTGNLSEFSNYGSNSVDVAAPGEEIISTAPGNSYVVCNGTSMAAAFVTGTAALLLSENTSYDYTQLKDEIIQSSDHLSTLLEKVQSGRKINAGNALAGIYPEDIIEVPYIEPEPYMPEEDGEFMQLYTSGSGDKAWYNNVVGPSVVNGINETKYSAWEGLQEVISLQTGDLTLKQTDIHLPGRNGLDLEIGRIYQSNQSLFGDRKIASDLTTSYSDYSTYYLNRYGLGTGWALNLPSVQVEEEEGETELYYHTGAGPKYHVEFTEDTTDSNLEDYYKKDVVFNNDTTYTNGEVTSQYSLTTSDKTKRYFAADGRLLGIKDRFGNEIVFKHTEKPVTNQAPNNDFEYTETLGMWGATGNYSYNQTTGKDDTTSLKFYSTSAVSNSSCSKYIAVTPNTIYYLGGYILNQLSSGTTGLRYVEYGSTYNLINTGTLDTAAASGNWELKEQYFTTSANTKFIKIEFNHSSAIGTSYLDKVRFDRAWPLISEITDSIGREINFTYTDTLYDENTADAGSIAITVNDPALEHSYSFSYTRAKWLVNYNWPTWSEQRRYPTLYMVDNSDKDTIYNYIEQDEKFSYTSKTTSGSYQNTKRPLLNQMTLRNSRVTYEYGLTTKHLGEYGFYETHRVSNRYEQQETDTGYTTNQDYEQTYTYNGIYSGTNYDNETGYPGAYTLFENPAYLFTSTMQQNNGLTINTTFKGKYEYKKEKINSGGEKETTINEAYDIIFPELPTKVRLETTDSSGTKTLYKGYTYNDWGGLAAETRALTQEQYDNAATKTQHTIYYSYDSEYKFLSSKRFYQSPDKVQVESTTYDTLGRKVTGVNTAGEVSQYLYEDTSYPGNLTTLKLIHSDNTETKKTFDYTGSYNAFATTITEHYTENSVNKTNATYKTYEYIWGNVLSSQDHLGNTTTYAYDSQGRLIKTTRPSAHGETGDYVLEQNYVYDGSYIFTERNNQVVFKLYTYTTKTVGQGSPETIAQANTYYDDHGNVLLSQNYDYERASYTNKTYGFNEYGQLTWAKDPYAIQTNYAIDEWGRLTSVTDAAGNQQVVDYDIYNRTKSTSFIPYGGTAENHYAEEYDQWGRVIVRKGYPDGIANPAIQESYQYDLVGNITKVTDARGNETRFVYDRLNRINRVINPLGENIQCDYERLGNLAQLEQYEGSTTFTTTKIYDERGSLISSQPPEGNPTTFKYNALGLPVEITDAAGKVTTLLYDNSNHLLQKDVNLEQLKYYYNPLGGVDKCEVFTNGTPVEHLDYDYYSTGLTKERTTGSYTTLFEYDLVGNRTEVTDPFGYAVNYQYDTLHRLDTITAGNKTFDYEYYADGMISAVNYPVTSGGSLRTEMTYDNLNRLTELKNKLNGNIISQYNYQYDNNGNISAVTENGTVTTNYTYDSVNRLTGITRANGEYLQYQYDTRGNRVQGAGITLREEDFIPAEFTYNDWEELIGFTNTDTSVTHTYQYDAEGLRTKKISPTGTIRYHYDNSGRVIAESNASDQVTAQNIWGHKILGRKIGAAYYYYLYNGHGDVVQIVNEAGTIVNSYSYDEWGNIRSKTETISNPIRYAGEYFDEESGLYYLRARYYDPVVARFITKDSYEGDISNPLSINQYSYCYNNPLIYVDPTGHYTQIDFSNWTGTAAQAAQLQALYTNYEAYNAGDIGSDTASNNYTRIMDDYEKTTNGNSTITKISNSNPDTLSLTSTPTTATQENKKLANIVLPNASQSYIKSEPEKNIFEFYHKLGVGLQVKIKVFGIGFELGVGNYYEDIHTNNPKHTIEGTFNIQITNKIFIGAEGKKSKSAVTGQEIKGSGEGFIGIRVFDQKLGWGDIPNSGDVIADNEVGALTPLGGFVAGIRTNLSELFRRLFN